MFVFNVLFIEWNTQAQMKQWLYKTDKKTNISMYLITFCVSLFS